jgi:hypothetical protein
LLQKELGKPLENDGAESGALFDWWSEQLDKLSEEERAKILAKLSRHRVKE